VTERVNRGGFVPGVSTTLVRDWGEFALRTKAHRWGRGPCNYVSFDEESFSHEPEPYWGWSNINVDNHPSNG
jgi:hypothetical protein